MMNADSKAMQAGMTVDARERKVTQLDPVALRLLGRNEPIGAESLRAMTEELNPGEVRQRRKGLIWGFVATLVFLGLMTLYLLFLSRGGIGRWRDPVLQGFGVLYLIWPPAMVFIQFRRVRKTRRERIRRVMLKHHHCPHCGYDIHGLPADEEDGATVCPECGCAWRVDAREDAARHDHD
jgi:hypothetical protein